MSTPTKSASVAGWWRVGIPVVALIGVCAVTAGAAEARGLSKAAAKKATRAFARDNLDPGERATVTRCRSKSPDVVICTFTVALNDGRVCRGARLIVSKPRGSGLSIDYVRGSAKCSYPGVGGPPAPDTGGQFDINGVIWGIHRADGLLAAARVATGMLGSVITSSDTYSEVVGCVQLSATRLDCVLRLYSDPYPDASSHHCDLPIHWTLTANVWHPTWSSNEMVC